MKSKKLTDLPGISSKSIQKNDSFCHSISGKNSASERIYFPVQDSLVREKYEESRQFEPRPDIKSAFRLKALSNELSTNEILMLRHGQLVCGSGVRPIVPRCMTAFPENFSDFLQFELPFDI